MLSRSRVSVRERGDTIIEVLFAVTIFSLVVVGALSIMNQGTNIAERSLETTLVRSEIDGQVNALRFLHDAYINTYDATAGGAAITADSTGTPAQRWQYVVSKAQPVAREPVQGTGDCNLPTAPPAFSINPATMDVISNAPVQAPVYARFESNKAEGLWIEAVGPSTTNDGSGTHYIDFYVNACWSSVGQSVPMTIGTLVRLYVPAA